MKKRVVTMIGDIFSVQISEKKKKYIQLIAFDPTQLNSDVIRAFKKEYPIEVDADIQEIVKGEVEFYAHTITKWGVKLGFWEKVGKSSDVGRPDHILFRDTNDYGHTEGEEAIQVSNNWYVWRIGGEFTDVGKLEGENRRAEIGIVVNPIGIIELLNGKKYPRNYPNFE